MTTPDDIALHTIPEQRAPASVLALLCSEEGAGPLFEELIALLQPKESVEHVSLPGGAWWAARATELTDGKLKRIGLGGRSPVREAVEAMVVAGSVRSILLLGHQDCAWYRARFPGASPGSIVREQGADLLRARDEIRRWSPRPVTAEAWLIMQSAGTTRARRL